MATDVSEVEAVAVAPAPEEPYAEPLIVEPPAAEGPARFFRDHPALYRAAVGAAAGTAIYAAASAARTRSAPRRIGFMALAVLTAGQAVGLVGLRGRAGAAACCEDQPTP